MATKRSQDYRTQWANLPVPTPGSSWPAGPLYRGAATPVMQAPGRMFKGTVRAPGPCEPCPCLTTDWQGPWWEVQGLSQATRHTPRPHIPSFPPAASPRPCPGGTRAALSCPGCLWGPLFSTRRTLLIFPKAGPHLSCQGYKHPTPSPVRLGQSPWWPCV